MARKKEFDEMTLITEESTINEPTNMAKKEEYLAELQRKINGESSHHQNANDFQFYPDKTVTTNKSGPGAGTLGPNYNHDGALGVKQDSVMTVTIDGTQHVPIDQTSNNDQFNRSNSRFAGSLVDDSFAGAARNNMVDQEVAMSQQKPIVSPKNDHPDGDDFQDSSRAPLDTDPASPQAASQVPHGSKSKKMQPVPNFLNENEEKGSGSKGRNLTLASPEAAEKKSQVMTPHTQLRLQIPFDEEEDIIEQTFGMDADKRNNQVFQDLPTPKSRMKREIDIEAETSNFKDGTQVAGGNTNTSGNQARKKIFEEASKGQAKRASEHKVTGPIFNSQEESTPIGKNQTYAASHAQIETASHIKPPHSPSSVNGSPEDRPIPPESPVEVQNLASYFEKMQVGKKQTGQAVSRERGTGGATNTIGSRDNGSRQKVSTTKVSAGGGPTAHNRVESGDFNQLEGIPSERKSPSRQAAISQHRNRAESSDKHSKVGGPPGPRINTMASSSKQASKYQVTQGTSSPTEKVVNKVGSSSIAERASKQASRTGSPQKQNLLMMNKNRDVMDEGLQNSNTPTMKDPNKNLGLKNKLAEALSPDGHPLRQAPDSSKMDAATRKMIIGYQQLKHRKHATSGEGSQDMRPINSHESDQRVGTGIQSLTAGQEAETRDVGSGKGRADSGSVQKQNLALKGQGSEAEPPTRAQFQMGIVGYHQKRQKSELDNELEATLKDRDNSHRKQANLTEAFNTKHSGTKNQKMRRDQMPNDLDIADDKYMGIASDFEGNLTGEIHSGSLRTRKLYSQQKRGTRKRILASALKKNKEFKEKTNTIEHGGGVSRGLDSQFNIEGRRIIDQIEIDNQSGGTQGNLLNNVDDLADGFNGSNFDVQSMQGYSQNQYVGQVMMGNHAMHNQHMFAANSYGMAGRVLSQNESSQAKRMTHMQHYQMIKGSKNIGFLDGQNFDGSRPLSHGQNQFNQTGERPFNEEHVNLPAAAHMLSSIDAMRNDYLHELPKSINIHSNTGSGRREGQLNSQEGAQKDNEGAAGATGSHHDFSFKANKSQPPIPKGKPRLETVPASVLMGVSKFLKAHETVKLSMANKQIKKKSEEDEFDSLWVLYSFQTMFSKTGLSGMKNAAQKRIDEALHQMHFQCESLRSDSKEVQVNIFERWLTISLILVFIGGPCLLIASQDFDQKLSQQILMLPITVSWGLLMLAQLYAWYRINKYHKRVIRLHLTHPLYRLDDNTAETEIMKRGQFPKSTPSPGTFMQITKQFYQKAVRGRNAKHCSLYTFGSFVNRFAMMNMVGLTFMYLGFFLKIYVLDDSITYLQLAPLSIGPLILMYLYEMICEVKKDRVNWKIKKAHISEQMANQNLAENLQTHQSLRRKINCGLIPNFILFTAYHGGFFCLLCMKLDDTISLSYFVILIPFWVFLLYLSTFVVISGLASTNQRVNKCERIMLSVLVPIGFILTIILGLLLADNHASFPIYATFIPLVASIIFLYLYVRCLIKPSKNDFIKVKPEQVNNSMNENTPQKRPANSIQISHQMAQQMAQALNSVGSKNSPFNFVATTSPPQKKDNKSPPKQGDVELQGGKPVAQFEGNANIAAMGQSNNSVRQNIRF